MWIPVLPVESSPTRPADNVSLALCQALGSRKQTRPTELTARKRDHRLTNSK